MHRYMPWPKPGGRWQYRQGQPDEAGSLDVGPRLDVGVGVWCLLGKTWWACPAVPWCEMWSTGLLGMKILSLFCRVAVSSFVSCYHNLSGG